LLGHTLGAIPSKGARRATILGVDDYRRLGLRKLSLPFGLPLCYTKSMKKARTVKQKLTGRPRTGITPLMGFRADDATRAAIMKWAENQLDKPTLSAAIRRLVEIGLKAKTSPATVNKTGSQKARNRVGRRRDRRDDRLQRVAG
jgi:hypothetical protein